MIRKFLDSTVGRKVIVAGTGLVLALFVLSHLIGNFLIFCGAEAYNKYSHALTSNPLIILAELLLLSFFILHIRLAVQLTRENRLANASSYAAKPSCEKMGRFGSKTMIYQGVVIFIFVIYHLITFKWGPVYKVSYGGVEMRDIAKNVSEVFQKPGYVIGYVVACSLLGIHLFHGFASAFQSLGLSNTRYQSMLRVVGALLAIFVAMGFISQPLYVFWWSLR